MIVFITGFPLRYHIMLLKKLGFTLKFLTVSALNIKLDKSQYVVNSYLVIGF